MDKPKESADTTNTNDSSPSRSPREYKQEGECSCKSSSASEMVLAVSQRTVSPLPSPRKSPRPQTPAQIEQLLVGADRLERMIFAHEMAVNQDFKWENPGPQEGTLEAKVKETIQQAFWDALQSSLSLTPPDLTHALVLLEEIRDTLLSLLPEGQGLQMRNVIKQNLDIVHMKEQAEHEALDFREKANFVVSIMGRLCAPARDEEIVQLSKIEEIVPLFREVFRVLEAMKVDMLNFTLKQVQPLIDQHSVEYEQQMFDEFLATQEEPLYLTKEWLRTTAVSLLETDDASPNPSVSPPTSVSPPPGGSTVSWRVSPMRLLKSAFLNLLDWNPGPYPETLTADVSRISVLQTEAQKVVFCAAFLLVTWNAVGSRLGSRLGSTDFLHFKNQLKNEIFVLMEKKMEDEKKTTTEICEFVFSRIQKFALIDLVEKDLAALKEQLVDLHRRDHPVRILLMKRLKETVDALTTPATPTPTVPSSLFSVQKEVLKIVELFFRIFSRNQKIFGKYYFEIISSLANELSLRTVNSLPASPSKQP